MHCQHLNLFFSDYLFLFYFSPCRLSVDMTAFTVEFEVENTTSSTRLVNWRIDSTNVVTTIPVASQSSQALIPITWVINNY